MTWHGYFAIGGHEVGNGPRAVGIQESVDCPIRWLTDPDECATVADALGHFPYSIYTVNEAPWYDADNADRSSRIYGLYPIEIGGLEDDTREVSIEQKVSDGAHIGRTRRGSRTVPIRALLVAQGRDALEAGMTWLRGTLDVRDCGMHSSACGMSDFEYFVDCPPPRDPSAPILGGYGNGPYGDTPYGQGPTAYTPEDDGYDLKVDRYRRYLHSVKCVSGPTVVRKMESSDGKHFGNIVEFTLVSELPYVFTKPKEIALNPTTPTVVNDVPFNFVKQPRPVNELTPRVVAIKNLETNPSLETDATGYSANVTTVSGDAATSYFTSGRVTGELSAVGTAAFRTRILGNGSTTAAGRARMYAYAPDVALDSVDERITVNLWAAMLSLGGNNGATLVSTTIRVDWRTASALISTTNVGSSTASADVAGKAWTALSLKPPATATIARVYAEFVVDWSSSATPANNSDIRAYIDAVAVTVP